MHLTVLPSLQDSLLLECGTRPILNERFVDMLCHIADTVEAALMRVRCGSIYVRQRHPLHQRGMDMPRERLCPIRDSPES